MTGSDAPRFLVRAEDGSEHPVASIEELSLWVASGQVRPETPIFDQGTRQWSDASDSSVVRFILDELAGEQSIPEPFREWYDDQSAGDVVDPDDPHGLESFELVDFDVPEPESTEPEVTLSESLASDEPGSPLEETSDLLDSEGPAVEPEPEHEPEPEPEPEQELGLEDWMRAPEPTEAREPRGPVRSSRASGPTDEPASWERDEAVAAAATAEPGGGGARSSRLILPLLLLGVLAAGLLLADSWFTEEPGALRSGNARFVTPGGAGLEGSSGADEGEPREAVAYPETAPLEGLEVETRRVMAYITEQTRQVVDSLRSEIGIADAPPPGWLSGRYLGEASLLPSAREFWEGYGELVERFRVTDRQLYLGAVRDGVAILIDLENEVGEEEGARLEAHLHERYALIAPFRQERFEQLARAAERAVALHDFLLEEEERIRYTPAMGTAVPLDPVLEAGSNDPLVHREMLRHLDDLFEALDRSRGGGRPPRDGLRSDLFTRLTES